MKMNKKKETKTNVHIQKFAAYSAAMAFVRRACVCVIKRESECYRCCHHLVSNNKNNSIYIRLNGDADDDENVEREKLHTNVITCRRVNALYPNRQSVQFKTVKTFTLVY